MTNLEHILEKITAEKSALDTLLGRLIAFAAETGGVYDKLSPKHKRALLKQREGMTIYSEALQDRIVLLNRDIANEYE